MSALTSVPGAAGLADVAHPAAGVLLGPPARPFVPAGEAPSALPATPDHDAREAESACAVAVGMPAQWLLQARAMPEFANASDADLMGVARDIRAASRFDSPQEITAWYRANPQTGSAPRQGTGADLTTAPGVGGQRSGGAGAVREAVRFGLNGPSLRRDVVIWRAFDGLRRGVLEPARAIQDSLRACAVFAAEVAQRVYCYSRIAPSDLRAIRELRPILRDPREAETREFAYVRRIVLGSESLRSILTGRAATLNERATVPVRALDAIEASSRPRRPSDRERDTVLDNLAAARQWDDSAPRVDLRPANSAGKG